MCLQCRRLVLFLGWEDPLEKGTATHSSILAWRIPGTYSPWFHRESDTTERLSRHSALPDVFRIQAYSISLWLSFPLSHSSPGSCMELCRRTSRGETSAQLRAATGNLLPLSRFGSKQVYA